MNSITAARQLLNNAAKLLAYEYMYDPEHKNKPRGGDWNKTDKGWSKGEVGVSLARHDTSADQEFIEKMKKDPTMNAMLDSRDSDIAPDRLREIYKRWRLNEDVVEGLAENESTPKDVLEDIVEFRDYAHIDVANNPSATEDMLNRILDIREENFDDTDDVANMIADRESGAPDSVIDRLSYSTNRVKMTLLCNPSIILSSEVLDRLSRDKSTNVRATAAGYVGISQDALKRLSTDSRYEVREQVACNPDTPQDILIELSKDSDKFVSHYANKCLKKREDGEEYWGYWDLQR